jgi:hypothetical protein
MNKIYILTTLLYTTLVFCQSPQAFNYSAVARNSNNTPIINTSLGIQVSIRQSTTTGEIVYQESHLPLTDNFGLFNIVIGAGNIQNGNMQNINWSSNSFFLEIGMDITGGTNYSVMGTTQLISVPYALHATTATSLVGGIPNPFVLPTLTTENITNLQPTTATLNGVINNSVGANISKMGFVISSQPNPDLIVSNNHNLNGIISIGNFSLPTTLTPSTTYYVKSYAKTINDIVSYGNEISFTTPGISDFSIIAGVENLAPCDFQKFTCTISNPSNYYYGNFSYIYADNTEFNNAITIESNENFIDLGSQLVPNQTYYLKIKTTVINNVIESPVISFIIPAPNISLNLNYVDDNCGTINANTQINNINNTNSNSIGFITYVLASNPNFTNPIQVINNGDIPNNYFNSFQYEYNVTYYLKATINLCNNIEISSQIISFNIPNTTQLTLLSVEPGSHGAKIKAKINKNCYDQSNFGFIYSTIPIQTNINPSNYATQLNSIVTNTSSNEVFFENISEGESQKVIFADVNTNYYCRAFLKLEDTYYYSNEITFTTLNVGQAGEAGTVFYDKGYISNGWRYLERPSTENLPNIQLSWGCNQITFEYPSNNFGLLSSELGENLTQLAVINCTETNIASKFANDYVLNNKDDWFLPTLWVANLINLPTWTSLKTDQVLNQNYLAIVFPQNTISRENIYNIIPIRKF